MNILIVNQPLNNRGDQAAHRAFIRKLVKDFDENNIEVLFLNSKQEYIDKIKDSNYAVKYTNILGSQKLLGQVAKLSVVINSLLPAYFQPILSQYIMKVKKADVVICAPGGICMGGFMDWLHVWQLLAAKKLNKKIIYWGRSIGPFNEEDNNHKFFKKASYDLIKYFDYISMRDTISYNLAKSINPNTVKTIDSAFIETPHPEINLSIKNLIGEKYVVFVPNELKWHYKFKDVNEEDISDFYIQTIKGLFDMFPNHNIVMLPQLYCSSLSDYKYFLKIKNLINDSRIIVIDESLDSDQQQSIISGAKFLIGGRYHSVIFAINNCVPFVSFSYEHKMRGLLEMLNLSEYQIDIEEVFKSNVNNYTQYIKMIKDISQMNKNLIEEKELAREIVVSAYNKMIKAIKTD